MADANAVEVREGGTIGVPSPQVKTLNPDYSTTAPFPFSAADFKSSVEAYQIVYRVHPWKIQAKNMREWISRDANLFNIRVSKELSK
jgi:hypothetical protein